MNEDEYTKQIGIFHRIYITLYRCTRIFITYSLHVECPSCWSLYRDRRCWCMHALKKKKKTKKKRPPESIERAENETRTKRADSLVKYAARNKRAPTERKKRRRQRGAVGLHS